MDEAGIWAQVLYPNVGGFGSENFLKLEDSDLKLLCVSAYNDFLVEWASADLEPVAAGRGDAVLGHRSHGEGDRAVRRS